MIHWFQNGLRISGISAFEQAIAQCRELQESERSDRNIIVIFTANENNWSSHPENNWIPNFMYQALASLQSESVKYAVPLYALEFTPDRPILLRSKNFVSWLKKSVLNWLITLGHFIIILNYRTLAFVSNRIRYFSSSVKAPLWKV